MQIIKYNWKCNRNSVIALFTFKYIMNQIHYGRCAVLDETKLNDIYSSLHCFLIRPEHILIFRFGLFGQNTYYDTE